MKKMTLKEITLAVEGKVLGNASSFSDEECNGVSTDTRTIQNGDLFIPIKGENFDGHEFVHIAYEKGCSLVITEDETKIPNDKAGILVKDTKKALMDLAMYYRSLFNIPIIAITGSVGKTSCKEMIASVLSVKYNVHKTSGNFNNEIGLPLTILKLEEQHDVAVIEMGMNHYGEIHRLSKIAKHNVAVITNIGVSHIEFFGSKDGILRAKSEILDFLSDDDLVVLNGDDEYLQKLKSNIKFNTKTFGLEKNNDYFVSSYKSIGWDGLHAIVKTHNNEFNIKSNCIGEHMLYNILPAVLIGNEFGLDNIQILEGIKNYIPANMRMNKIELGKGVVLINDAYNASVDSMRSALATLSSVQKKGRKVAILGDMFEMGEYAQEGHKEVGVIASKSNIDLLICIGKESLYIYDSAMKEGMDPSKLLYFNDQETFLSKIESIIKQNDQIIVKASRGMHLERTAERIQALYIN